MQPYDPITEQTDRWATDNLLRAFDATRKDILGDTSKFINTRSDEPLKAAACAFNWLGSLSQDVLFKINCWKRNALFCLVRSTVVCAMKERLSVPDRVLTVYNARLEQLDEFQKLNKERPEVVVCYVGFLMPRKDEAHAKPRRHEAHLAPLHRVQEARRHNLGKRGAAATGRGRRDARLGANTICGHDCMFCSLILVRFLHESRGSIRR